MFGKFIKRYYGTFIALIVVFVVWGILSVDVLADTGYVWVPVTSLQYNQLSGTYVRENGLYTGEHYNCYVIACNNVLAKAAYVLGENGTSHYIIFATEIATDDTITTYTGNSILRVDTKTSYNDIYYGVNFWNSGSIPNSDIPIYSSINDALLAMDDGNWTGADLPEPEPEYTLNESLGYLLDVNYQTVYNADTEEQFLKLECNRYTSTGVDLSQNDYGVRVQLIFPGHFEEGQEPEDDDSGLLKKIGKKVLDWLTNFADMALLRLQYDGGGGGHSFDNVEVEDGTGNHVYVPDYEVEHADVYLMPYHKVGSDYEYGYTTILHDLNIHGIGSPLLRDYTSGTTEGDVYNQNINQSYITVNNIDYSDITTTINNMDYYIVYESTVINEDNYYNYQNNYTDITNNDIDIYMDEVPDSTINIFDDSEPIIEFSWDVDEVRTAVNSFLTVVALFPSFFLNLFTYIPEWALSLIKTICVLFPVIAVIKLLNNRIKKEEVVS